MPEEVIMFYIYGDMVTEEMLIFRLASIWVLTILVHFGIDKKAARRNPNKWACAAIFYISSYGIQFVRAISICELTHQGDILYLFALTFLLIVAYLYGDVLEDLIFGDLDRIGGIWHNWAFFMPPYTIIILGYVLKH